MFWTPTSFYVFDDFSEIMRRAKRGYIQHQGCFLGKSLVCLCVFLVPLYATSEPLRPSIHSVKASFVYNAAKFVSWPKARLPTPETPLRFIAVGNLKIRKFLELLAENPPPNSRKIEVLKEIKPAKAHVLFIGKNSSINIKRLMLVLKGRGVLVISDHPKAFKQGVHIQLFVKNNRLRFQANQRRALNDKLQFGSQLLTLAEYVKR